MRFPTIFILLPILTSASALLPRDNTCHTAPDGGACQAKPSYSSERIEWISDDVFFDVSCSAAGLGNTQKWAYVPGRGCWIIAEKTNAGCEDGLDYRKDFKGCL
ncbi:hypothetical protein CC86DRAFT_109054 [Ophiobolus disseminans]|uniref:Uncharacterized protein n=1 Tax=Ophiobolus disseminans TaxID=1469910 RepID=A0A6A6ZJN5_9PLEO|nr:hypothetical protein CC86DRAFT_109054 [Ophiobolus disseminans]